MRHGTTLATLITLLAIVFLVKLGFWQLERAAEKQKLFDDFAAAQTAFQPLPQDPSTSARYTPVKVTGTFADSYLLLDNKIHQGNAGYHVIGLLNANDRSELVPVNLGWVPVGPDRRKLPMLELPSTEQEVIGWLYRPAEDAFTLAEQIVEPGPAPWRVQQLDFNAIGSALELPIANYLVLLSEAASYGWPRQWQPQVMTPAKHQAYALQWFSLAIACLVVFIFARRSITKTKKECE
ncbi:SURF1 family protein [Pseudidiomarina sp. E22-M8]|uniref:SURF1 family protein n=1 Tax=Pseudidiomarina sp. E22-M8 TaxID=3424768 RepID=UPI00403C0C13